MRRVAYALLMMTVCGVAVAAPAADMEMVVSEKMLTNLLVAFTPIEQSLRGDIGGLNVAGTLRVTLSSPQVHVTNSAIKVKMGFRVRDESGVVDLSGVATPDLRITAVPGKKQLEAHFVRFMVTFPGGVGVPLDGYLQPIALPGVWTTELFFGERRVIAEATATEVVLETGQARLRGVAVFKPQ